MFDVGSRKTQIFICLGNYYLSYRARHIYHSIDLGNNLYASLFMNNLHYGSVQFDLFFVNARKITKIKDFLFFGILDIGFWILDVEASSVVYYLITRSCGKLHGP